MDFQFGGRKHYGGIEMNTFCLTLEKTHSPICQEYDYLTLNDLTVKLCEKLVEEGIMYKDQFYFLKMRFIYKIS